MSELKVYVPQDGSYGLVPEEGGVPVEEETCYLKSEVDKIFRRLKARLARKGISNQQLEIDKNNNWRKYCQAIIELRHNKYKRCLAMAKICEDKLGTVVKPGWWNKWHKRWLGLAEKFKEVK